jgi:NAD-dependent oxidoreductase involved in siderophore biosynthesis
VIAPGVSCATTSGPSGHGSLIEKYGPTVWEGVIPGT